MFEWLQKPWPWYVAGPLIGLMVPLLLLVGNKTLGVSSSLRHLCATCLPTKIPYFTYDWKKEAWNLILVLGIFLGGWVATRFLSHPDLIIVNDHLLNKLQQYGVTDHGNLVPVDLFNWPALLTLRGFTMIVIGGFLVGFGTRYAGGCTSGHSIMGLSNLQVPSLIATCCFMTGGFIMTHFILPFILSL